MHVGARTAIILLVVLAGGALKMWRQPTAEAMPAAIPAGRCDVLYLNIHDCIWDRRVSAIGCDIWRGPV